MITWKLADRSISVIRSSSDYQGKTVNQHKQAMLLGGRDRVNVNDVHNMSMPSHRFYFALGHQPLFLSPLSHLAVNKLRLSWILRTLWSTSSCGFSCQLSYPSSFFLRKDAGIKSTCLMSHWIWCIICGHQMQYNSRDQSRYAGPSSQLCSSLVEEDEEHRAITLAMFSARVEHTVAFSWLTLHSCCR